METSSSAGCSASSSSSRLPRFTPRKPEVFLGISTAITPRNIPLTKNPTEFKQPKHRSVQALSLAIKKRYSTGRKGPGVRNSPSSVRSVPTRKPAASTSSILGKRPASENVAGAAKKPRVLVERNRVVPAPETNKATVARKAVAKSRFKSAEPKENSNVGSGPSSSKTPAPQKQRKVQPWDLRGRLEVSQETIRKLREDLELANGRVADLENLGGTSEGRIKTLSNLLAEEKALSASRLDKLLERDNCIALLRNEEQRLQDLLESQRVDYETRLKTQQANFAAEKGQLTADLVGHKKRIEELESDLAGLNKCCEEQKDEIDKLHDVRKTLHNQVQDLKGNIRVLCRLRPPTSKESSSPLCHILYNDQSSLELYKAKEDVNPKKKTANLFSFDRIFPAGSTQAEVYEELEQLVQSCLDGYNVCVFAYGQTGSGKTFTMDGAQDPETHRGMIPRTVHTIFNKIDKLKQLGWDYIVDVFFVEIYNEQIHDLLNYNNGLQHDIRMVPNKKNDVTVTNLRVERVNSQEELNDLMTLARNNRFVASTVCNTHSSRSHFIMKIAVTGANAKRQLSCSGSICLVDLAGSEKYEDNNSAERRKETMNINKSLSSLTNVIMALKQKNDHVPYRVSKLTHLLMPCLGGSAKTLMIVNISPLKECFSESVNAMRFASSVNQCQVLAKKNEKTTATL